MAAEKVGVPTPAEDTGPVAARSTALQGRRRAVDFAVAPVAAMPAAAAADLLDALGPAELAEVFAVPLLVIDLDDADPRSLRRLVALRPPLVLVGAYGVGGAGGPRPTVEVAGLDVVVAPGPDILDSTGRAGERAGSGLAGPGPEAVGVVTVDDVGAALAALSRRVAEYPIAAVTLVGLLRASSALEPVDALVLESLAYSTLLAGPEFARWLAARGPMRYRPSEVPLLARREPGRLRLTLNRPEVRNAYDTATRDALVAALRAARSDSGVREVILDAAGPSFGSGGDLSQFGTAADPASAHLVRTSCSAAAELVRFPCPIRAHLHGACVGAGIELPAFATTVMAAEDTVVELPELGMGLVPGAGGTVSVTRRIGRQRMAWIVLAGARIDVATAARWGLVDEVET